MVANRTRLKITESRKKGEGTHIGAQTARNHRACRCITAPNLRDETWISTASSVSGSRQDSELPQSAAEKTAGCGAVEPATWNCHPPDRQEERAGEEHRLHAEHGPEDWAASPVAKQLLPSDEQSDLNGTQSRLR